MFTDLVSFLSTVVQNLWAIVVGALLGADQLLRYFFSGYAKWWDEHLEPGKRKVIYVLLAMLAFVVASFMAYHETRQELAAVKRQVTTQTSFRDDNSLYQDGRDVAVVKGVQLDSSKQIVTFTLATASGDLDMTRGFEFRDWKVICSGRKRGSVTIGAVRMVNYENLICQITGNR